jgi:dihydrolipoamide dehydrogenase
MLAHRAVHEGKQVIELLCGVRDSIDLGTIPSVLYTDPEIAWVGLNETEATQQGLSVKLGQFPWSANARALSLGCQDGMTQIVADATTGIVLGAQIVGPHAGDLIAEIALAINAKMHFGAIADTIHPHPTLGETVGMACEDLAGTATDLPPKNR